MEVTYAGRADAWNTVAGRLHDAEVVLDLGPGICPQPFIRNPYVHICVEAHLPYIERVRRESGNDPKYVFIHATWDQGIGLLPDKCVDTVFALDFIEHLEKEDGLRMLREAERVARRQVLVYTPLGFFPQSYDDPAKPDRWGMDGGYWQTHRSGWQPEDFGEGWEFVVSPDYITLNENNQRMDEPMPALWAIRTLGAPLPRRYYVMEDDSAWRHFTTSLERALPPRAYGRLRSVWGAFRRVARRQRPPARMGAQTPPGQSAA
jgi:methyltransferase family protein